MQRRAATSLAAQALREFRDRASLAQRPASFQALYSSAQAQTAAAPGSRCSSSASGNSSAEGGGPKQPHAAEPSGAAAAPASAQAKDAEARQPEERMAVIFTCNKCNMRAMRSFSKQAYTSGVVIIKCPECSSRHLIADRLGWFGDNSSVESILKEKGQEVRWHEAGGTLELSDADAAAWSQAIQEAKTETAAKAG